MDTDLKNSMNRYYDERAEEYDRIYYGAGPASISDPSAYKDDVVFIQKWMREQFLTGSIMDIPCGTAFWLPCYCDKADEIVLLDQSANMLKKARQRAETCNCLSKCSFVKMDALEIAKAGLSASNAFIGFFLSHLTNEEEHVFLAAIKTIVGPKGKILIVDSAWTKERAMNRNKEDRQIRKLNDNTEFEIYKKYFSKNDVHELAQRESLKLTLAYFGRAFFCAVLERK